MQYSRMRDGNEIPGSFLVWVDAFCPCSFQFALWLLPVMAASSSTSTDSIEFSPLIEWKSTSGDTLQLEKYNQQKQVRSATVL